MSASAAAQGVAEVPGAAEPPAVSDVANPEVDGPEVIELPPVPEPPPPVFSSQRDDLGEGLPLAGIHGGRPYLRDARDHVRLYPGAWLRTDFHYAPGAPDLPADEGESRFGPSFFVRRLRLELSGELFRRLAFSAAVELGADRVGRTVYRGPETDRFGMPTAHDGVLRPAEVTVSYALRRWLGFTAGVQNVPFSMSNRTREPAVAPLERPLAIRGFVVPQDRDIGLTVWGDLLEDALSYELGIFAGDGVDRPFADTTPDGIGRIHARPLAHLGDGAFFDGAQIGVSGRIGGRDPDEVTYDYPTVATNQGWVLWQPGYVDSLGRLTHIIPSGLQRAIGGELRLPFDLPAGRGLDVQAEGYYAVNDTREAVEGFLATNSERFGRVRGAGWYAQISFWALGDPFANGAPGVWRRPSLDLRREQPIRRGLEVLAIASGVNADYSGATREGSTEDPRTPRTRITSYQVGGGVQYWYGTLFRAGVHYMAYIAPESGTSGNLALVPDNVPDANGVAGDGHVLHELGARLAASF